MTKNRKFILVVLVIAGFSFVAWRMAKHWNEVDWTTLHLNPVPLALSFVAYFGIWELVRGIKLRILYKSFGYQVRWWDAVLINSSTRIAKYIPGGVWFVGAKSLVAERFSIPLSVTWTSAIVDAIFLLSGIGALLAITILANWLLGIVAAIVCVVVAPTLVMLALRILYRIWPNKIARVRPNYAPLLVASTLYVFTWIVQAVALYLVVVSFYPTGISLLPKMATAWYTSWLVGFITPFAPGGLGVRDAMFSAMLSPEFPIAIGGLIAIITRIWLLICETVASTIGWICLKR